MMPISMKAITAQNWRQALLLQVTAEQQRFVAGYTPIALLALAKAYVRPNGWLYLPFVFANDESMVGMALLAYAPTAPDTYWLFHFFIDHAFQSQGYGTAAFAAIRHYLQTNEPACHRLCLTVHPDNIAAQHLYLRQGFQPAGELIDGEPLYQLDFLRK